MKAIRRLKRGAYSIDLIAARKQVESGTLPASDRRMIERIMGEVLPTIDPLTGKLKTQQVHADLPPQQRGAARIQTRRKNRDLYT